MRTGQGEIVCDRGGRRDCTVNARTSELAHEISSMIDRVIEQLKPWPWRVVLPVIAASEENF
jgi:hypothetical protein